MKILKQLNHLKPCAAFFQLTTQYQLKTNATIGYGTIPQHLYSIGTELGISKRF